MAVNGPANLDPFSKFRTVFLSYFESSTIFTSDIICTRVDIGTILNIILDPIFIFDLEDYGGFGLGMGVKGAAMASVVSQIIVFSIFIYMLFWKEHSYINFNLRHLIFLFKNLVL